MKAVIRALIGLLALSVCLVVAAPSAAARTLPVVPAGAVTAVAGRRLNRSCRRGR